MIDCMERIFLRRTMRELQSNWESWQTSTLSSRLHGMIMFSNKCYNRLECMGKLVNHCCNDDSITCPTHFIHHKQNIKAFKAERKAKKKTKKIGPVLCFDGGGIEPLLLGRVVKLFAESVKPQI